MMLEYIRFDSKRKRRELELQLSQSGMGFDLGLHLTLALCHKFARRGHLSIKLHCGRLITQIDNMFNCHFIIYSMGDCIWCRSKNGYRVK